MTAPLADAHELNNLLARIIALAEDVTDRIADRPGAVADLEALISAAEAGGRLVGRLVADSGSGLAAEPARPLRSSVSEDVAWT